MSRKLTLLALLVCAAVTGLVLWGLRDDSESRTAHREAVAEPEPQPKRPAPSPDPDVEAPPDVRPETTPKPATTKPTTEPTAPREKGDVLVQIVDQTGRPLVGTKITVIGPDEEGRWRTLHQRDLPDRTETLFDGLRPGRVSLLVTRGDLTRSRSVDVPPSGKLDVTFVVPEGATVSGVVRHMERGPLPEVTLEAKSEDDPYRDTLTTVADKEGHYTLRNVPPGRHGLKITGQASGYEQHPRASLDIPALGTYERDIVLGRIALRGIVREAGSGTPISGARVQIQEPYFAHCASADDGTYVFRDLTPGKLRIALTRDGYETRFYFDVELPEGEAKVLDLELVAAAILHVHLKDDQDQPVIGTLFFGVARVGEERSLGTSIRADESGRATYDRITPGKYVLSFRSDETELTRIEATIEPGENSLEVVLKRKADLGPVRLKGVVRDAVSGDPLLGVEVRFTRGMQEAVTDQTGTYRFRGLQPGTYAFFVMRDGYGFHIEKGVVVEEGKATTHDIALRPAAVLHLHVTDAQGRPAVGQLVFGIFALEEGGTRVGTGITADAQGDATYRRILPGRYKLTVTREGLRAEVETEIRPGENRLEFVLK